MDLLDHSDHLKAGRALVLTSASYVLLDQCSSGFSEAVVLGIKVHISKSDLLLAFWVLSCVFLSIFAVRVIPKLGMETVLAMRDARLDVRDDVLKAMGPNSVGPFWAKYVVKELNRNTWRRFANTYYQRKAVFLGRIDFILLLLLEVLPPLTAFAAIFIELYPLVCPNSPLSWPLP